MYCTVTYVCMYMTYMRKYPRIEYSQNLFRTKQGKSDNWTLKTGPIKTVAMRKCQRMAIACNMVVKAVNLHKQIQSMPTMPGAKIQWSPVPVPPKHGQEGHIEVVLNTHSAWKPWSVGLTPDKLSQGWPHQKLLGKLHLIFHLCVSCTKGFWIEAHWYIATTLCQVFVTRPCRSEMLTSRMDVVYSEPVTKDRHAITSIIVPVADEKRSTVLPADRWKFPTGQWTHLSKMGRRGLLRQQLHLSSKFMCAARIKTNTQILCSALLQGLRYCWQSWGSGMSHVALPPDSGQAVAASINKWDSQCLRKNWTRAEAHPGQHKHAEGGREWETAEMRKSRGIPGK